MPSNSVAPYRTPDYVAHRERLRPTAEEQLLSEKMDSPQGYTAPVFVFSEQELDAAHAEYVKLKEFFASSPLGLTFDAPTQSVRQIYVRASRLKPALDLIYRNRRGLGSVPPELFTFHVQHGRVYGFPFKKLPFFGLAKDLIGLEKTESYTVDEAIRLLSKIGELLSFELEGYGIEPTKQAVSDLFAARVAFALGNIIHVSSNFTGEDPSLFKNVPNYVMEKWFETYPVAEGKTSLAGGSEWSIALPAYLVSWLKSGLPLTSIVFALSPQLNQDVRKTGKFAFEIEEIRQYGTLEELPLEWLEMVLPQLAKPSQSAW